MEKKINGTISKEIAIKLNKNFTDYIKKCSEFDPEQTELSNCAWFSITDLEDYLASAKEACKSGEVLSGIRFYFGKRDSGNDDLGTFTVFISPTLESNDNKLCPPEDDMDMNIDVLDFGKSGVPPCKIYPFFECSK